MPKMEDKQDEVEPKEIKDKQETSDNSIPSEEIDSNNHGNHQSTVNTEDDVVVVSGSDGGGVGEEDYGTRLLQEGIYYQKEIQVSPQLVESLTQGFVNKFLPSLERNKKTIDQIKNTQSVLIETVQQENAKFESCHVLGELEETMLKAKKYHTKLLKLRREMTGLHEKTSRLKKRSVRLQQQRQKEELTKAQRSEVEWEREKMLAARVVGDEEKTGDNNS